MTAPVRLRLSRAKGFNLQEHSRAVNGLEAVVVTRGPGRVFGNPFTISFCSQWFDLSPQKARVKAVDMFREWAAGDLEQGWVDVTPPDFTELRGKNLACWCALGAPCHADVLLEIANRPTCERVG